MKLVILFLSLSTMVSYTYANFPSFENFAKIIEKEKKLSIYAISPHIMDGKNDLVCLSFVSNDNMTILQTRILIIDIGKQMQNFINENLEYKSFFHKYPIDYRNLHIGLEIRTNNKTVSSALLYNGKIIYHRESLGSNFEEETHIEKISEAISLLEVSNK